ncbi:MAG: hypothetical protein ACRDOC_00145 [Streptosporangiaceae bacterium]
MSPPRTTAKPAPMTHVIVCIPAASKAPVAIVPDATLIFPYIKISPLG